MADIIQEQVIQWSLCDIMLIVLCKDIFRVHRTSEISLPKTMNMISTDDHHEFVLMVYVHNFKDVTSNIISRRNNK